MNDMSTANPYPSLTSPIKVIGVGGGGSNAVNTMYDRGIQGVDFIVCNTDAQALDASPVPVKVQLGATLTGGQGAGSLPDVGRNAAIETLEEVKEMIGDKTSINGAKSMITGGRSAQMRPAAISLKPGSIIARLVAEASGSFAVATRCPFTMEAASCEPRAASREPPRAARAV